MAINKNDYLDGDGNYDLKKALVDELIDDVNTLTSTTTATVFTNQNGWTGTLYLSRYGDLVSIKGYIGKTGTVTNDTQVGTIPAGFRPPYTTPIAAAKGNTSPYDSSFLFWIYDSGSLVIQTTETIPADRVGANLYINQIYSV